MNLKAVVAVPVKYKVKLLKCSTHHYVKTPRIFLFLSTHLLRHLISLSLHLMHDLSKKTGKLWIISYRFSFCIKLSLVSAMMKIINTTFYCIYTYFLSNKYIPTLIFTLWILNHDFNKFWCWFFGVLNRVYSYSV